MNTVKIIILLSFLPGFHTISNAQIPDTVKIGFLIADRKSPAAIRGAELAIIKANEKGGLKGKPFKLVTRSMEGAWGTGSREATNLIFDEKVIAIVGSHDGRNAHVVEQVCTKARVVFISAWTGDPTLSQAFVPWFFTCVPNNTQQAELLVNETYINKKFLHIAVVSDTGYDSELALKYFVRKTQLDGKPRPIQLNYQNGTDLKKFIEQIGDMKAECIILFATPSFALKFVRIAKESKMNLPLYGALSLLDENELPENSLKSFENVVMISPGHWFTPEGSSFIMEFKARNGYAPGALAAYAYDAVILMVDAIRDAGTRYDLIQKSLADAKYNGVTGLVQFDARGNRKGPFRLMEIKNGMPVELR